jgi:hypothetical protein
LNTNFIFITFLNKILHSLKKHHQIIKNFTPKKNSKNSPRKQQAQIGLNCIDQNPLEIQQSGNYQSLLVHWNIAAGPDYYIEETECRGTARLNEKTDFHRRLDFVPRLSGVCAVVLKVSVIFLCEKW